MPYKNSQKSTKVALVLFSFHHNEIFVFDNVSNSKNFLLKFKQARFTSTKEENTMDEYEVYWVSYPIYDADKDLNYMGTFATLEDAIDSAQAWCDNNHFRPLHIRQWKQDNIVWWDYGSPISLFKIVRVENKGLRR